MAGASFGMPRSLSAVLLFLLAACAGRRPSAPVPVAFSLPDSVVLLDGSTGRSLPMDEALRRIGEADIVLLGEVHDNGTQHALRGRLLASFGRLRPAVVFEQFAETHEPISRPAGNAELESWLDRHGFDRQGWKWPLHRPVVEAAVAHARSIWGSGLSREALRDVVRGGEAAAPSHLRPLLVQAPLDSASRALLDRELIAGHCGKLPAGMVEGMRAAQTTRDAAMARLLIGAADPGPSWLIAGNGHVRRDFAVPRLLRQLAPRWSVLAIGLLEREEGGALPAESSLGRYDLVLVTPRVPREDPCAGFQVRPSGRD